MKHYRAKPLRSLQAIQQETGNYNVDYKSSLIPGAGDAIHPVLQNKKSLGMGLQCGDVVLTTFSLICTH